MEVTTYSTHGNPVGTKIRHDNSRPGQRCVTYHNVEDVKKTSGSKKKSNI